MPGDLRLLAPRHAGKILCTHERCRSPAARHAGTRDCFFDISAYILAWIELRFLRRIADGDPELDPIMQELGS